MTTAPSPPATDAGAFPRLLAGFRARLDGGLETFLGERRRRVSSYAVEATELVDALADLVRAGGKRLRPALVFHGFLACGGEDEEQALTMALAVELFHSYLLLHDDIMDHAPLRRGRPSAQVRFRDLHALHGWHGDAPDYGAAVALLVGDLAHVYALEALGRALAGSSRAGAVQDAFFAMSEEVIAGQHMEMRVAVRRRSTEEELLDVLRLKSGAYSVEHPLNIGALLAGTGEAPRRGLQRFGRAVGEAFQLQDDILGLFGDAETLGKPVGGDLAEGKLTLLVFHALESSQGAARKALESVLGREGLTPAEVERAREVVRSCGALERVRGMIAERLGAALGILRGLELEPRGRAFLEGLISYLDEREL